MLASRYYAFALVVLAFIICVALALQSGFWWWYPAIATGLLTLVGIRDLTQTRQSIRRNYPLLSHFRFFFEMIRPEIRQYLLEDDNEETPFSRAQRSIVYQRAKDDVDKRAFGTQLDVYEPSYEWINHSIAPTHIADHNFRVLVGGPKCKQA